MKNWKEIFRRIRRPVPAPEKSRPGFTVSEEEKMQQRLEREFRKIDALIRTEQLFLDSRFSIKMLALTCGLNRTYVSRAINSRKVTFRYYINSLRIEYLRTYLRSLQNTGRKSLDLEFVAESCGFSSKRMMDAILRRHLNHTFQELTELGYWDE